MPDIDKTRRIYVYDDFHPEDNAMLQALYSRSPQSVVNHIEKIRAAGSGNFMSKFYVGYGHASIGDCGSTTIFIENASMLAAKAIQDHPLYNGQEASTRYLDFSVQPQYDPYDDPASAAIQEKWLEVYNDFLPRVQEALRQRHPFSEAEYASEKVWEKAIFARSFDILRSLLPIGTTTLLSWHTNLRQARDHLRELRAHPLAEIREIARQVFDRLYEFYPHSFTGEEMDPQSGRYAERNAFQERFALEDHFLAPDAALSGYSKDEKQKLEDYELVWSDRLVDVQRANRAESDYFKSRPKGAPVSKRLFQYGLYNMGFLLDFGSFRDIQRHRNGYCPIPLADGRYGMHRWYMAELEGLLPEKEFEELQTRIDAQLEAVKNLRLSNGRERTALEDQYLFPMGVASICHLTYSIPQMVYVSELRAGKTVHPSLRPIAQQMGRILQKNHPDLQLFIDTDEDSWSAKRGEQDIQERKMAG